MTTTTPATTTAEPRPAEARPTFGILRNVTSTWFSVVVGILISFVLAPLTVHSLGNVYYGIWTLLSQFTGYLWLFDLGVRESVVKYVAQHHAAEEHDEIATTVRTAVSLYSVVALVALAAVTVLSLALPYVFNIPPDAVGTARVTAILTGSTIAQSFVFNVFVGVLMGLQKYYLVARLSILFSIVRAAMIVALLSLGQGVIALAALQFAMTLVSNLLVYRECRKLLPYLSFRVVRPKRQDVMKLVNYGKYVLISNVGDKIVFATDSIVIGMFLPISAITYYAIGGTLIEQFRSFVASAAAILNPLSSSLEAKKETRTLATLFLAGSKAAMLLGLPVCIGFIVLGERFISLWMGPAYGPTAGLVLAVLAAGHLLGLPYYGISAVLYGLGRHRIVAYSRVLEGVANIALSLFLIKRYGLVGVALGTVIPHAIVVCGVLPSILPSLIPIGLRQYYVSTYVRPWVASVPFWFVCLLIDRVLQPADFLSFMGSIMVGLVAYAVPCWFLALSPAERDRVREAVRRLQPRVAVAAGRVTSEIH